MDSLEEWLKTYINDKIYTEDITNIVLYLRNKLNLQYYINAENPVDFSVEEFHGESLEDPIDYSEPTKQLMVNMSVLGSRLTPEYDASTQPFNWMKLLYEIFYIMEDVKITKYLEERTKNNITKIIKLYDDFKNNKATNLEFTKYIDAFKKDEIGLSDSVEDPIERIKKVHAYFNTLDVFKKIHLDKYYINGFKNSFINELLKGYAANNQNVYPLRNVFFQNSYIDGTLFMVRFPWYENESMVSLSNATKEVHSLEERLALGYPIDYIEYQLVRDRKI